MNDLWVGGATGFLGKALVHDLLERGHALRAIARRSGQVSGLDVHAVNVLDRRAVAESARGARGAFLAFGMVSRDPSDADALHRVHVDGVRSALLGLRDAGVRRAVVVSSSGTVAVSDDPTAVPNETAKTPHELIGRWPYYRSKWYGEQAALAFNAPPEFEVVVANPSLLLGPGDERGESTRDVRLVLEGRLPALPRGGIAFVDVRDAARGLLQVYESGAAGERYLLSGANMPCEVFFGRVARLAGVTGPRWRVPKAPALAGAARWLHSRAVEALGGTVAIDDTSWDMAMRHWYCDAGKARRELGFQPRPAEETLRDTVHDLLERQ